MKKINLMSIVMLVMLALSFMVSCSKDDDGGSNGGSSGDSNNVVVNDKGSASDGSIFSAIDDKNFYLDYIKYSVEEGHLVVTGYDKTGLKGGAKIAASIVYKGNTYEVLAINNSAFYFCKELTSVNIPTSVTSIGISAFSGCSGLTSVVIPNGVTTIEKEAFAECKGLTSIKIPASIISIHETAFAGCDEIISTEVDKNNTVYESRDGKTIIEKATNKLIIPCPSMNAMEPSIKEIVLNPAKPHMGEKVTATLKLISAGKNWHMLGVNWTLSRYAQEPKYFVKWEGISYDIQEPNFTFVIPDTAGLYTLRLGSAVAYSTNLFTNGRLSKEANIENNSVTFTVRAE